MLRLPRLLSFLLLCASAALLLPQDADARSSQRRNYAEEWRQEEREERAREERERARKDWLEHSAEQQERYIDATADRQESYQQHRERQLDRVIDHYEGRPGAAAPAPPKPATGTCIYGANDKVIHQPKGVVCKR